MVNNNFQLIGTMIENFEKKVSGEYVFYEGRIEVESRMNGGNVREFIVKVSSSNKKINPDADYEGKIVVISGYLDSYKFDDGGLSIKLCATDLFVATKEETEDMLGDNLDSIDLPDDDLPF